VILHVDLAWILDRVEHAGLGDPAPEDFGVPVAAVERHKARLFDRPVYDGPYVRAAALAHTLGRCPWLEHSNLAVAVDVAVQYLYACGIEVAPEKEDMGQLVTELRRTDAKAVDIARVIQAWPTVPRS
jgi:hypothetical protein